MKKVAFVFPGQGSQYVGMGREIHEAGGEARSLLEAAGDALAGEVDLLGLLFEGPKEDLTLTANTQPAVLAVSLAAHAMLEERLPGLRPTLVAGHSLGEYTALAAVGAIEPRDALKVVRRRGLLMQEAAAPGTGAMAAVIGIAPEVVAEACLAASRETGGVVVAANFNSRSQTVISGEREAVEAMRPRLRELGARRVMMLPVSAPFHSPLMESVGPMLAEVLLDIRVSEPRAPIVSNVSAAQESDPERIRELLIEQVASPVRWVDVVHAISEAGVTDLIEIGPGKVLCGLIRAIDDKLVCYNVEKPSDLEAVAAALGEES